MTSRKGTNPVLLRQAKNLPWSLMLVFFFLIAAILISGFFYYKRQKNSILHEQTLQLQAVADLKAGQVKNWLEERMGDARLISSNLILSGELIAFLRKPAGDSRREPIHDWMLSLQANYHYENVLLLDQQGRVVLAAGSHHADIGIDGEKLLDRVRARRDAMLSNLHENPDVPHIHLDIAAPLLAGGDVAGFVLLRIDPGQFLYPLIQSWPTPSPSAETLLVRRDGDEVLFLNELRHRKNTALKLREPLSRKDLPAVQAALKNYRSFSGRDYRGVAVWSVVRPLEGTTWSIVAKVDRDEIERPIRRSALAIFLVALAMVLAAALMILFLWQRQNARFRLRQLEAENEKQALVRHFDYLSRYANDLILLSDKEHNIVEANERAVQSYGFHRKELLAMNIKTLRVPDQRTFLEEQYRAAKEQDGIIFETVHQRRDGSTFPVEVSARIIRIDDKEYFQSIYRDISERKKAEAKLLHANRLYAVLSQVNQAIVRAKDRNQLFQDICNVAIEFGKFRLAWIGLVDLDSRIVKPAFQAGDAAGYLGHVAIAIDALPAGQNPTGKAIRTNRLVVQNDIRSEDKMAPWRLGALQRGYLSSAALPLRFMGECIGALMLYSDEVNFFDAAQTGLLEEITSDIAYALDAMAAEASRVRAEAALAASEAFVRSVLDHLPIGVAVNSIDPSVAFSYMNDNFPRFYRTTRERLARPDGFWEAAYEDPSFREEIRRRVLADCAGNDPGRMLWEDIPLTRQGEETTFIIARNVPIPDKGLMISLVWDVSERKRSEEALRESEDKFKHVFEAANVGKSITLPSGEINVNKAFCDMLGYDQEELQNKKWQEITPAEEVATVKKMLEPLLQGQRDTARFSKRYICKDGSIVWGDVSVALRRGPDGKPLHFITTVVDISERRQAENKLEEQHALLRIAGELARIGGWNVNLEENRSYWSDEVAAIHEMPPGYAPLVEEGINFYAPEWRERITKVFSDCAQKGIPYNEEMEIVSATGKRLWVQTIGEAVRNGEGKIIKVQGAFQDISARKQAEKKLQKLSERNQALLEAVPDIIMEVNNDKIYTWANQAGIEFFGADVIGREAAHYFHGEQTTYQQVKPLFNGHNEIIYVESWQRRRDGEKRLLAWWCRVLNDEAGKIIGALSSGRDITDLRRAEEALRESERRFRETVVNLDEGYYSVTPDGTLLDHNQAFNRILGFEKEKDLRGTLLPDFWQDPGQRQEYLNAFAVTGSISNYQIEAKTRNGEPITVLASAHLVRDLGGRPKRIEGVFLDISERIRSEQEIVSLNVRLNYLIEAVKNLSTAHTMPEIQRLVASSARKLTGADGATMVLREGDSCFYVEEDAVSPLWKGKRFPLDRCVSGWVMLNKTPAIIPDINADERVPADAYRPTFVRSLAMIPVLTDDAIAAIGIYWASSHTLNKIEIQLMETLADAASRSIETVKLLAELEARVLQRTALLETANKELEAFSYSVSHDLRAPLRAIDGFSRIILEEYAPRLDNEGRRLLDVIAANTHKMGHLIDDLLAFSRLSRQQMKSAPVNMAAIAKVVFSELKSQEKGRSIEFKVTDPPVARGDHAMLQQVLQNLLANAVKFTRTRKVARIEFNGRQETSENVYSVRDNGVGFEAEYAGKLFGVFQRLHSVDEFEGTGVGLAIVQRIVLRHGGRVWAESKGGKGATFYFSLPTEQDKGSRG